MGTDGDELAWVLALRHDLKSLPVDYTGCRERLQQYRAIFQRELAATLEPRLNVELCARPQHNYDDKRELASWVNREAGELGLSPVCQKTGKPATIAANYRDDGSKSSRFQFIVRTNGERHVYTVPNLSDLHLCEDPARREGPSERFEKEQRGSGQRQR
jgi:hypothetical protein